MSGPKVMPFYIVIDTSTSMRGEGIDAVNAALPELHRAIVTDPVVADRCRLGIIAFATTARFVLPLSDLSDVRRMPRIEAGGRTNFVVALEALEGAIAADVATLRASGCAVMKPCAFFITDGRPGDGWRRLRDQLVHHDNRLAPEIVAFGVGTADLENLRRLSTGFTFRAQAGANPATALRQVFSGITSSIVASTRRAQPAIVVRDMPSGIEIYQGR